MTSDINSPYALCQQDEYTFQFCNKDGQLFLAGFMQDESLYPYESYQFYITNASGAPSYGDNELWQTIFALIDWFTALHKCAVMYICDTSDGKQAVRNRLFVRKAKVHNKGQYIIMNIGLHDDEEDLYMAFFIRADHPDADAICTIYEENYKHYQSIGKLI